MTKQYHKLVRDRIPEIIARSGKQCRTEVLTEEDYLLLLDEKLGEELSEYRESGALEELADLLEVMEAVEVLRGRGCRDLTEVCVALASQLVAMFRGISAEEAEAMQALMQEELPDVEINLVNGGQPVYYFIISAE